MGDTVPVNIFEPETLPGKQQAYAPQTHTGLPSPDRT